MTAWAELEQGAKDAMTEEAAREIAAREELLEELARRRGGNVGVLKIGEKDA